MGILSRDSTSSTQQIETRNLGGSDQAVVAGETVNILDAGVIDRAFTFAKSSADLLGQSYSSLLRATETVAASAKPIDQQTLQASLAQSGALADSARENQKLILFAAVALAAIVVWRM